MQIQHWIFDGGTHGNCSFRWLRDIAALTTAIREASQAKGPPAKGLADFCKVWKQVEPLLQVLKPVVGLIPVVGPIASAALTTLLSIGNTSSLILLTKGSRRSRRS